MSPGPTRRVLGQEAVDDVGDERRARDLTAEPRGDAALRVDHEGRRHRVRRHVAGEREQHGVVGRVEDRRVGDAVRRPRSVSAVAALSSTLTPRKATPWSANCWLSASRSSASSRQGPQAAYQKLSTTTSPARSALETCVAGLGGPRELDRLAALVGRRSSRPSRRRRRSCRRCRRGSRRPGGRPARCSPPARGRARRRERRSGQGLEGAVAVRGFTRLPGRWILPATLPQVPDSRPRRNARRSSRSS